MRCGTDPNLTRHLTRAAASSGCGCGGIELVRDQRDDVLQVVRDGDHLAVQLTWRATLSGDLRGLPAGTPLVAHVAAFYEFRDGLILSQSSYDCYEPIGA